jgi:protein phosphatase
MNDKQPETTYSIGFRTDVGRQRSNNEDAGTTFALPGIDVAFVVCDGMGGMRAGDIAALTAVETVQSALTEALERSSGDLIKALAEAFRQANDAVNALTPVAEPSPTGQRSTEGNASATQADSSSEKRRFLMGTTCVAGVVRDGILYLAHAGDSRAYRWRRGHLTRLTEDHSFVAERVRAGDMTEAEARVSRFRNIVTRAIGIDATVEPEFRREPLEPGDLVLVCSDGLTTMLDDPEISALLNRPNIQRTAPDQACAALIDAANRAGGADNITVLIIKVSGEAAVPEGAGVIDIDAPRPRNAKAGTSFLWILLGILLTLALLMALFTFYAPFRQRIGRLAIPPVTAPPPVDFATLVYDAPRPFAPNYLARGDILTYAPGKGLYFVAGTTGKLARLDGQGTAVISIETLEIAESPTTFSPTHVFVTSDPQGNAYISYTTKKIVEKKGADGKLLGRIRGFQRPEAIAVDEQGNIYVVDFNQVVVCRAQRPASSPTSATTPAPGGGA